MTSSNVSNLFSQVQMSGNFEAMPACSNATISSSFENTLSSRCEQNKAADSFSDVKTKPAYDEFDDGGEHVVVDIKEHSQVIKNDSSLDEEKMIDYEAISDEFEEYSSKMMSMIKDSFDIDDSELQSAMELLGLTAIDLVNPQNLTNLIVTIDENVNCTDLLVRSDFNELLSQITELTGNLLDELEMSLEDATNSFSAYFNDEIQLGDFQEDGIVSEGFEMDLPMEELVSDEVTTVLDGEKNTIQKTVLNEVNGSNVETDDVTKVQDNTVFTNSFKKESNTQADSNSKDFLNSRDDNDSKLFSENMFSVNGEVQKFEPLFFEKEAVVSLPTGENVEVSRIIEQIVEQAKVTALEGETTMEMVLNPEGLGKVVMSVTQKGDEITAKLFTENEAVKEALENQMATLRTDLNNSSQKITSVEVTVGSHEFERNLDENARNEQQSQEQAQSQNRRSRTINLSNLDDLDSVAHLMSPEELIVAQMMRDNGNTLDFMA